MDSVGCFARAWEVLVGGLSSHRIERKNGSTYIFGNVPQIFFNVSVREEPVCSIGALSSILKADMQYANDGGCPACVAIQETWLPQGWEEAVRKLGVTRLISITGMEATAVLPALQKPGNLEIRRVDDDLRARDFADLNARAYGLSADAFRFIANVQFWRGDRLGYVAYCGDEPVSCAAAYPVLKTTYLAMVATAPEARRIGLAGTVVRHTLSEAHRVNGLKKSTLHATDMALGLYRSMGYLPDSRIVLLALPPSTAATRL